MTEQTNGVLDRKECSPAARRRLSELSYLLLLNALIVGLWVLHLISNGWFVKLYLFFLIPLFVIKVFFDYRRKGS
jgi:uncharacterized membrane protein